MKLKGIILILVFALLLNSAPIKAADNLTWDHNYQRTRATLDQMGQIYNESPIAVSIGDALGTWLYSYSTPVVYDGILYQYAFNILPDAGYLRSCTTAEANNCGIDVSPLPMKPKNSLSSI